MPTKYSTIQPSRDTCRCGRAYLIKQLSPFEFSWHCACGNAGVISWAHANPPPTFTEPTRTLFEEIEQ